MTEAIIDPTPETTKILNKVAIIRHGDYDLDKRLSATGKEQMEELGTKLENIFAKHELIHILSSSAPRALDSAEVLANILCAEVDPHELLWSEVGRPEKLEAAYHLIHSVANNGLVIVVTHFEYLRSLPRFLGRHDLKVEFGEPDVDKGKGVLINYKSKKLSFI